MDFSFEYWRLINWVAFILLLVVGCIRLAVGELKAAAMCLGSARRPLDGSLHKATAALTRV